MSELPRRILSALVLIGISLLATTFGGSYFLALCIVGALLIFLEYSTIARSVMDPPLTPVGFGAIAFFLLLWLLSSPMIAVVFSVCIILLFSVAQFAWKRRIWAGLGFAYAILPFIALVSLRGTESQGLYTILLVFGCVWGADTFAYFSGRTFGGPKLAPAISPNKTWSGFFGGLAGSIMVTAAICMFLDYGYGVKSAVLATVLGTVSSIGDLFESWIKRRFGAKDSGRIIPGHGGLLDRIDGLIFAAVAAWILGWLFGGEMLEPGSTGAAFLNAFILP